MSRPLWEVDPETKAKLLEIQKQNGNHICVDCRAPSPQWASPKFGIFMCLNCSGIHRGLGVHISFIRSVTMDGFKVSELKRMQLGGNKPWQDFFDNHKDNKLRGRTFEDSTIKDRYDGEVGEEWKDRLTAQVEGIEYVPMPKTSSGTGRQAGAASNSRAASRSQTPLGRMRTTEGSPARSASPMGGTRKAQNEAYFAKMGQENASRPADLPPNQGGKFSGFGSEPAPPAGSGNNDWFDGIQKDPVAGLTKGFAGGFSWLSKNAKTINDGWVKPNMQKLAESDLAAQARLQAAQAAQTLQSTTKTAAESITRFVEGDDHRYAPISRTRTASGTVPDSNKREFWDSFGAAPSPEKDKEEFWDSFGKSSTGPPKEKQEFWDSFAAVPKGPPKDKQEFWDSFAEAGQLGRSNSKSSSSIGTSAMRKVGVASGGAAGKSAGQGG